MGPGRGRWWRNRGSSPSRMGPVLILRDARLTPPGAGRGWLRFEGWLRRGRPAGSLTLLPTRGDMRASARSIWRPGRPGNGPGNPIGDGRERPEAPGQPGEKLIAAGRLPRRPVTERPPHPRRDGAGVSAFRTLEKIRTEIRRLNGATSIIAPIGLHFLPLPERTPFGQSMKTGELAIPYVTKWRRPGLPPWPPGEGQPSEPETLIMMSARCPRALYGLTLLAEVCLAAAWATRDPTTAQMAMILAFFGLLVTLPSVR